MTNDILTDTYEDILEKLATRLGVLSSFFDASTAITYQADTLSKSAIVKSLGYLADTATQANESYLRLIEEEKRLFCPYTKVFRLEEKEETTVIRLDLHIPQEKAQSVLTFSFQYETGEEITSSFSLNELETITQDDDIVIKSFELLIDKDFGYHTITFLLDNEVPNSNNKTHIIIAPNTCYTPITLNEKHFGFPVQLYAIKSACNFGIGDFTDLLHLMDIAKKEGASFIGINPLNALFSDSPNDASPYFPSSRLFLNPLYIDLDATAESASQPYQNYRNSPLFLEMLQEAQSSRLVNYELVSKMKNEGFILLNKAFREDNLLSDIKAKTRRGEVYLSFIKTQGKDLEKYALFQLLRNYFAKTQEPLVWRKWAKTYQDSDSDTLQAFKQLHQEEYDLICYQQFIAFEQFNQVKEKAKSLPIGLYTDLPVGVSDNSADVWTKPKDFLQGVTTGAPADLFNKDGQDWSLAPFNPYKLQEQGYAPYKKVLRTAMAGAGAIRIDHAFGLMRLYLRVEGATGAYLKYPFEEMIAVLALESHRNKCLVIGEDLGTAPEGFFDAMRSINALSFKIMHFQTTWGNTFINPKDYEEKAILTTGTHDMPTYLAFMNGTDLDLSLLMGCINEQQYLQHKEDRILERKNFIRLFNEYNLLPENLKGNISLAEETLKNNPKEFMPLIHHLLSVSACKLVLVRLEDILGQQDQVNLPGTYLEYPNWRYKLPYALEDLENNHSFQETMIIMRQHRKNNFKKEN